MQDYRKLDVWNRSHLFTLKVYQITRGFPPDEKYGLVSQLRRASASVPANLAEGCGRSSSTELARFAEIAHGSASEAEYHLLLSQDLGYLPDQSHVELSREIAEIKRMLGGLIRRLRDGKPSKN